MTDLSVIVPSRNEEFLGRTIQDLLENIQGDTEIIVVLDGQYPSEPIPVHPKVSIIYHSQSIGQRAAMNEAAKISSGKYIMKVDAHCAFDHGFDVKLLADMQPDWTVVPTMRNLHVFDWVCPNGHRRYQGPSGVCRECGEPTKKDIVWIAKTNPQSKSYCFDSEPHFQYFGEYNKRPEGKGDLTETMSLQGSCFMLSREKYFELNVADEALGSWGSQGIEVSLKTWLSGGRVICNQKTWYAHCFRTSGGDFGFPYSLSGHQVENAKKKVRDLFFNNKWDKQIKPLSWLVEKFWPVKGWSDADLARVREAGAVFEAINPFAFETTSLFTPDIGSEKMSELAMGFSSPPRIFTSGTRAREDIHSLRDKSEVGGITTPLISTNMINDTITHFDGDRPIGNNIHKSVDEVSIITTSGKDTITPALERALPIPASSIKINNDSGIESIKLVSGENGIIIDGSHEMPPNQVSKVESERSNNRSDSIISYPSAGIIYYTDNRLDSSIMNACQKQLITSVKGKHIVSVSLQKMNFGDTNIVLPYDRSYLTMFRQILAGLEAIDTDIVFFCEHDVLYHPSHFEFIPPKKDTYYYNYNCWKVRLSDGHALKYDTKQTSQLCAYRDLLIQHYKERVRRVEAEGFSRRMGFEPGSHHRAERVDDYTSDTYQSKCPNIDIRHDKNLTSSRWRQDQFRDQRNCQNWQEAEEVAGWYKQGEFAGLIKGEK